MIIDAHYHLKERRETLDEYCKKVCTPAALVVAKQLVAKETQHFDQNCGDRLINDYLRDQ